MTPAAAHRQAHALQAAMCGPECLQEVLFSAEPQSRGGGLTEPAGFLRLSASAIRSLAREMGTTEQGTSMEAMADAARRHGLQARGLELTEQRLEFLTHPPSPSRIRSQARREGEPERGATALTRHA